MGWVNDLVNGVLGNNSGDSIDWTRAILTLGGGYALSQMGGGGSSSAPTGYQGGIPRYAAVREAVPMEYDPNRRPGSAGRRYFSDTAYAPIEASADAETPAIDVYRQLAQEQATGLAALNRANPYIQNRPAMIDRTPRGDVSPILSRAPARVIEDRPVPRPEGLANFEPKYAAGGIAQLAGGGRYLTGASDGMADQVRANIDGQQEARLSDGEFVIPADVVSHLGNGNSNAGAKQLEQMMANVRKARTGRAEQGKQINPARYMPSKG